MSRPVAVKICGLTRREDALAAAAHGASYLGVILASGPRLLTPAQALEVVGPRRAGIQRVGVFGAQPLEVIVAQAAAIDLDIVQWHVQANAEAVRRLMGDTGRTVWPVVRVAGATLPPEAVALAAASGHLVVDALVPGQLGGTGVPLDWVGLRSAVDALRARVPGVRLILAGGLRPANVAHAISILGPDVVDVSSGVEMATGVKDPAQVQAFVQQAHGAAVGAAEMQA